MARIKRALTIDEFTRKKFVTMAFEGDFKKLIGTPERSGAWIIWGESGNGKTRFALQLAKHLCKYGRVIYNSLEEGVKLSFQRAIVSTNFKPVANKFQILDQEPIEELIVRLKKQKSAQIIFIDSLQYTELNKNSYKRLINTFPSKLFIFISHAEGKKPKGTTADSIRYDADVKIFVDAYMAYCVSRFGGGKTYSIWNDDQI